MNQLLLLFVIVLVGMTTAYYPPYYAYPYRMNYYYGSPFPAFNYYRGGQQGFFYPPYYYNYFRSGVKQQQDAPEGPEEQQQDPETIYVPANVNGAFGSTLSIQSSNSSAAEYFPFVAPATLRDLLAAYRSYQNPYQLQQRRNNRPPYQQYHYNPYASSPYYDY